MLLVKDGKSIFSFYILDGASKIINRAALDLVEAIEKISGAKVKIDKVKSFKGVKNGVILAKFSDGFENEYKKEYEYTFGTDGFAVKEKDGNIYILAHCDSGVFYGAHDFLEKNAPIVWTRGAYEYMVETLKTSTISATVTDFCEKSPFNVRVMNTIGYGTDNVFHGDTGITMTEGRNKIQGVFHHCNDEWYEYAVTGQSLASAEFRTIEEYIDTNPEYFMTDVFGKPRKLVVTSPDCLESFVNYYHPEVPKIIARKLAKFLEKCHDGDIAGYNMPDNPYFFMHHDGVNLHEQPFTTDCGVTVYPDQPNYKSTVYFNFINRLIKELNRIRPNTIIHTQAYMYSEIAPEIKVDDRVVVKFAPLTANMQVALNDPIKKDNHGVRDNLLKWCQKSNNVAINAYWGSFNGHYYSRPICKVAQQDLKFWRDIGVNGFTPCGRVDCVKMPNMSEKQQTVRKFNDFNETYTWILHKLMWDPDLDIEELKKHYCKIVYKEVADEMLEYFHYIEKGYESVDAFVWWMNGADVLIYQFILKAGVKDGVLNALKRACEKATTPTVKDRVESIYETLSEYIARYENFVDEEGEILWVDGVDPLDQKNLDYLHNKDSVWNKAKPSTIIKDFFTMEETPGNIARRMLFDGKNLYFGYTMENSELYREEIIGDKHRLYRKDGTEIGFRAETYIGGNALNTQIYYGYTSGFNAKDTSEQFFINDGSPKKTAHPDGVRTIRRVYIDKENSANSALQIVQIVPLSALDINIGDFKPYGHFCIFTDRSRKIGWRGFGLWAKQNFSTYKIDRKIQKI